MCDGCNRVSLLRTKGLARPLLPAEEWRRVEAYAVQDAGLGTDAFGTNVDALGLAYAVGFWLHQHYFRVQSVGHASIPKTGAAIIAGNHSGVLPFDGVMLATDIFRHTDPPRLMRYMVDYFVYQMPFLNVWFRSLGQIPGTRRNFDGLMDEGHIIGVFPEGADALAKPKDKRYQLLPFSAGHVELAARHGVPIVPVGIVGAEEQMTFVADIKPLARLLRVPYFPITTTFPWLGPLGLLPKPVQYRIHYGEPLLFGPDVAEDLEARDQAAATVRDAVLDLIDDALRKRRKQRGTR